jgi:hypothetical protein
VDPSLKTYYQFNESSGVIMDRTGNNVNAAFGGTSGRVTSTAPVGTGNSERQTINTSGLKTFANEGIALNFDAGTLPNGEVCVTRLNLQPDALPTGYSTSNAAAKYWIINNYGTNSTFTSLVNLTATGYGNISAGEATMPSIYKLYKRNTGDYSSGTWTSPVNASSATSGNDGSIGFTNPVTSFNTQFTITKDPITLNWTGATSSDWDIASNWSPNIVADANISATITDVINDPVVNESPATPAVCNDLTITSGALTINPGMALTVKGILSNNAGTSGLVIKSDATGTGSLIENNAVNATAERYITQDKWHYISAPVDNPTANVFLGLYMMKWDEPTETWTYISDPNYSMATDMQGFAIWSASGTTGNKTVTFSGNLNTGAKSIVCTNTAGGPPPVNDGYNFAGNPYPSALDWNVDDGSGWIRTAGNIDMSLYIWNHTAGNYGVYVKGGGSGTNGVDNIIAPHQGFFIHCTAATGSLGVNNGARIHNTKEILKSGEDSGDLLILMAEGNNYYDEIILKTDALASVLLDPLDGMKMYSSVGAPQLYSLSKDGKEMSINAFTESEDYQVIPLGMNAGAACEYSISVKGLNGFNTTGQLVLEDLKEGTFTPLFANTSYSFTADPLDEPIRFLLHLNGELDVPENLTGNDHMKVYSFGQQVYISSADNMTGMVSIYDLPGKEIFNGKLSGETMKKINLAGHRGYLIVKVLTETGNLNQKVFIK